MSKDSDEKKFNETLRNLLSTPPSHHADEKKGDKAKEKPRQKGGAKKTKKRKT